MIAGVLQELRGIVVRDHSASPTLFARIGPTVDARNVLASDLDGDFYAADLGEYPFRFVPPLMARKPQLSWGYAWQGRGDSNPRPSVLETDALPTELHPFRRCSVYWQSRCRARPSSPLAPDMGHQGNDHDGDADQPGKKAV